MYWLLSAVLLIVLRMSYVQCSDILGTCVQKKSLEWQSCSHINGALRSMFGGFAQLHDMKAFCKFYGCEWQEEIEGTKRCIGEGSSPIKVHVPCFSRSSPLECTGRYGAIVCKWLEHRRDNLYLKQYMDRDRLEMTQPEWGQHFVKQAKAEDKYVNDPMEIYLKMVRDSFLRYSLDAGEHKLEHVVLTAKEIDDILTKTRKKKEHAKITTADDADKLNSYIQDTDDTFSRFGGKIFLTYGPKEGTQSVYSGEATFVSEDKLWLITSAHLVTNEMWLHDDEYQERGKESDDLDEFIDLNKIPGIEGEGFDTERFIVSPHLLKFIDHATIHGKKYDEFHIKKNEIAISEILVPLGYFENGSHRDLFEDDDNTPWHAYHRNRDIAFVKLHIEGGTKRRQHEVNHRHVIMKAYDTEQYTELTYDTFSSPPNKAEECMNGQYSLWKYRLSVTDIYAFIIRIADESIQHDKSKLNHGQSGMCLLIHKGDRSYETVGVYSGPNFFKSKGYHFTRITHDTLKTFHKATH